MLDDEDFVTESSRQINEFEFEKPSEKITFFTLSPLLLIVCTKWISITWQIQYLTLILSQNC